MKRVSRVPDHLGESLGPICVAGLLLFGGLVMAVKPLKFLSQFEELGGGLRRFDRYLQARWPRPFQGMDPSRPSAVATSVVRLFGVGLATLGIFVLGELLH